MGLQFLQRDERVLYIAEAFEAYKQIKGIKDITELSYLYTERRRPAVLVIDEQYAFTSGESVTGTRGVSTEARLLLDGMVENTGILLEAARRNHIPKVFLNVLGLRSGNMKTSV